MSEEDWGSGFGKAVAMFLNGRGITGTDARGQRIVDDSFVLMFNAHHEDLQFVLPPVEYGKQWQVVLDSQPSAEEPTTVDAAGKLLVEARSLVVLACAHA